jgi:cytochrome c peroxidase
MDCRALARRGADHAPASAGTNTFLRTIIVVNSPYGQYRYEGEIDAMPVAAIRGEALFFSEKFELHHCHNKIKMSDNIVHARAPRPEIAFNIAGR